MKKRNVFSTLVLTASIASALTLTAPTLRASDHADSPSVAGDQAADLADCYLFQDPADATKLILINTVRGFIVPGEAVNLAIFDPAIRYRFQIENTEDAKSDAFIDVTFSEKVSTAPQVATVKLSGSAFGGIDTKGKYTANATAATLATAPAAGYFTPAKLSKDGAQIDVEFFAGETDDPFYFDIPGFARFRTKALAKDPTAGAELNRGRDTFAGYNVLTIAFRLSKDLLVSTDTKVTNKTKLGLSVLAQRGTQRISKGRIVATPPYKTLDREGLPAVNALLVPLELKNAYNAGNTLQDAEGKFAPAIVKSVTDLGISETNLALLASLAVEKGDILRLDTTLPASFPNGRKPADDVVDTLLTVIAGSKLGDSVNSNEKTFENVFPYLALPHQPRLPGQDDQTQN